LLEQGTRRILCVGPTGCGKSRLARAVAESVGPRSLVIAPSKSLATQLGHTVGGKSCTVQAFLAAEAKNRRDLLRRVRGLDVMLLDEAHRYVATERGWDLPHRIAEEVGLRVVGFTATPQRADGAPLARYFDAMVKIADYSELVEAGHLTGSKVVELHQLDPSAKPGTRVHRAERASLMKATRELCAGKSTLVFVEDVQTMREHVAQLVAAGDSAEGLTGETDDETRDAVFARFMSGETRVIVNVALLTEGIDLPRTEAVVLSRTCDNAASYLQIAGRGLRPFTFPDGRTKGPLLFVDLVGVARQFGPPHQDRTYSLHGLAISGGGEGDVLCGTCFRANCSWQLGEKVMATVTVREVEKHHIDKAREWAAADLERRKADGESAAKRGAARGSHNKRIAKLATALGRDVSFLPDNDGNGCRHCAGVAARGALEEVESRELQGSGDDGQDSAILAAGSREERIRSLIDARHKKRGGFVAKRSMRNVLVVGRYNRATKEFDEHPGDWAHNYPNDEPLTGAELWGAATDEQREKQRQLCREFIEDTGAKPGVEWFHVGAFEEAHEKASRMKRSA
jgi:superfamily II DNA or RNA helicase